MAFEISNILLLEIVPETIRQMPKGGVSIPIARLVTMITPLVRGSTPREFKIGVTTGVKSIKEAVVSTKVPISRRNRLISTISRYLFCVIYVKPSVKICCILFIDRYQENTEAIEMMISMIELILIALKVAR